MELLPLQSVTSELVRDVLAEAMRDSFTPDAISDFLASVVWSNSRNADAAIRDLLFTLEQWDTQFVEGDSFEAEYKDRLRSVLSGTYAVAV